ncbi:bacteriohemerythrin [Anaeromyxobacter oryzae]|uniref:Hemerythrin n=1 Tax=Anaeromyxobacter oryzae TaxID=2918170 RepID=A0ABM7X0S7_9BACT|nr:hemerythrin family protein [Anaeromyxobacter oryzae]BDG05339.1 hemerythrin [Anaeromyxobacter oryzae]
MIIEWSPDLAVGDPAIDAQHQELFRRVAALSAALDAGDGGAVEPLFTFLRGHVVEHFGAEERVMREIAFPGYAVHRAAHDRFVRELEEVRRLFEVAGPTAAVALRTRTWIVDWLVDHITFTDRALARHVARGPPTPTPSRPLASVLRR